MVIADRTRRVAGALAMPLAYAAYTLLFFYYLWSPIAGANLSYRWDPVHEYWGDLLFQLDTLGRGHIALWNPFDRGGYPLYGDPQPGLFYPGTWLAWLLSPLTGRGHELIECKVVLHWIFGAVGMHLFLRRRRCPEAACYLGGLMLMFTGPGIRYGGSTLNFAFAWLPWILLAIDRFADRPGRERAALLGTAVAMPLLAGAPAMWHYGLLFAVPFGVYRLWGRLRRSAPLIALAAAVALLWVAPLVIGNLEQLPESVRAERDLEFVTHSVFHPTHFLNFLLPRPAQGEIVFYGVFALLCFGLATTSPQRTLALVLVGVAVAGIALGLGNKASVLAGVASALSPFTLFRVAHRYLYLTSAAVAVGAALGFAYALRVDDPAKKRALARKVTALGGLVTFALGIGWVVVVAVADKLPTPTADSFGLGVGAAAVSTWMLRRLLADSGKRREVFAWAAVAATALILWLANGPAHAIGLAPEPDLSDDALIEDLDGVADGRYRIHDHGVLEYRPGVRLGVRDMSGYEGDPLGLARYKLFVDAARADARLFGHGNVRYVLVGNARPRLPVRAELRRREVAPRVYELPAVAPVAYFASDVSPADTPTEALARLRTMAPGREAVVEDMTVPRGQANGQANRAPGSLGVDSGQGDVVAGRVERPDTDSLIVDIETPGAGLVVINEAYFPAWEATVDGQPAPIYPANVMFRGVWVDGPGRHRIHMQLRAPAFWALAPAPLLAALLAAGALVRTRRPKAESESESEPESEAEPEKQ